ncbi:hypothetical protein AMATHDRAFT_50201 [Amanita thiersii Skay4041]|uniref:Protein kinase domain-containing protein n=1 Tax=Amanita thiersii Skay4041 TaxID=703135 RepID=A0A2A9NAA2_9AGAR|nr:hypothetical protein AMATHDRAFT_50201 [Amanita thiersii Skay4041]
MIILSYVVGLDFILPGIELRDDDDMQTLREAMKAMASPALDHLPAEILPLFKVESSIDLYGLTENEIGDLAHVVFPGGKPSNTDLAPIARSCKVSDIFSQQPPLKELHIVSQVPEVLLINPYTEDEQKILAKLTNTHQHSTRYCVLQCPIQIQYSSHHGAEEEFGRFKDDCKCEPSVFPSPEAQKLVLGLTIAACKWVNDNDKAARRSAIYELFRDKFNVDMRTERISGTDYETDGHMKYSVMPAVIRESKNEIEMGYIQPLKAIAAYVQCLLKAVRKCRGQSRFPCIIMVDIGSCLGFYGCLWTEERLLVEPLTPLYGLTLHWRDESGRQVIALTLDAFLEAIPRQSRPLNAPLGETILVHTKQAMKMEDESGCQVNFTYFGQLGNTELVFLAACDDEELGNICIKFTRRSFSHHCGPFRRSLGLSTMQPELSFSSQDAITTRVLEIVQILHLHGFVHGDIRSSDVMLSSDALKQDYIKIHVINFDLAGRIGQAVYPMGATTKTFRRPKKALDGGPGHDIEMVHALWEFHDD